MYSYRTASQSRKYISDLDLTPRASHESWKFIPPSPDTNSSPSTPSNQPLVYTTSAPYYNECIHLATPRMGVEMGRRSPSLLPTLRDGVQIVRMTDTNRCSPQTAQTCGLCLFSLFDHPQDLAPCHLSTHPSDHVSNDPSDLESPDHSTETPAIGDGHLEAKINLGSPVMNIACQSHDTSVLTPLRASTEKCVYIFHTLCSCQ
jgi:hypothetical protein